jgi:DNA-binding MarR family transcriptional regulator
VDIPVDDVPLESLLVQVFRTTGRSSTQPVVADLAVSVSEAIALLELQTAGGISQGELANRLGLEKSTVSRLASTLAHKGWITRERDPGNQRYVRLALTRDGGVIAERVWDIWHARHLRLLGRLSESERSGLRIGLRGLIRALAAEGLLGVHSSTADNPAAG